MGTMAKRRARRSRVDTPGRFAMGDIPPGFENPRTRLPDAPLAGRGKVVYYAILAVVIVGGIVLIWLSR